MHAPLISVFTLCTELIVTALVFYVIYKAYTTGVFARKLAFGVLTYEVLFNISYMVSRELAEPKGAEEIGESSLLTLLAIFHGAFSMVMFLTLLAFFILAARAYRRGENFFLGHRRVTIAFLCAWTVSILSGVAFFTLLYIV